MIKWSQVNHRKGLVAYSTSTDVFSRRLASCSTSLSVISIASIRTLAVLRKTGGSVTYTIIKGHICNCLASHRSLNVSKMKM